MWSSYFRFYLFLLIFFSSVGYFGLITIFTERVNQSKNSVGDFDFFCDFSIFQCDFFHFFLPWFLSKLYEILLSDSPLDFYVYEIQYYWISKLVYNKHVWHTVRSTTLSSIWGKMRYLVVVFFATILIVYTTLVIVIMRGSRGKAQQYGR